jgi:predicted metal-binding membrane protein
VAEGEHLSVPDVAQSALERLLQRDRLFVVFGLAAIIALSWFYLLEMSGSMQVAADESGMHAAMSLADLASWGAPEVVSLFIMWAVMMAGMMLPSATPVMLLVVGTYRRRGVRARWPTALFGAGYMSAWVAFSAAASLLQFQLHEAARVSGTIAGQSAVAAAGVFLIAGTYQWLPVKHACLGRCRSPQGFLLKEWQDGLGGAFSMGLWHGLFCVGCCWALMAVLFAAGVMNLLWVAGLAALVFVEKLLPRGTWIGRVAGIGLAAWGGFLLLRAF